MSDAKLLRCLKCGKPLGYVTVAPKSFLAAKPSVENIKLVATCPECSGGKGFYRRNF